MVHPQYHLFAAKAQGRRRLRPRRCLCQGCERWFVPSCPQARYCSDACRQRVKKWNRWHAARHYRATTKGKQRRQQQSRRHRQRRQHHRQSQTLPTTPPPAPPLVAEEPQAVAADPPPTASGAAAPPPPSPPPREGHQSALFDQNSLGQPCARPGCFACFTLTAHSPAQRFCCTACRKALRRVHDRERRWKQRHPRQQERPPSRSRPPP